MQVALEMVECAYSWCNVHNVGRTAGSVDWLGAGQGLTEFSRAVVEDEPGATSTAGTDRAEDRGCLTRRPAHLVGTFSVTVKLSLPTLYLYYTG